MPYDPQKHHRRSIRLPGYDYTRAGVYFVTICTYDRLRLFGRVTGGRMHLNEYGRVVEEEWERTAVLRDEVVLDAHVVMPNHVHGLIVLFPTNDTGETRPDHATDPRDPTGYRANPYGYRQPDGRVTTRRDPTAGRQPTTSNVRAFGRPVARSLPTIVGAFKSAATRSINRRRGTPGGLVWQRGYYERIVRDERAWRAIRRYIAQNPARWEGDKQNPMKG